MSNFPKEICKICQEGFRENSEAYYWHLKIHQINRELGIPEQVKEVIPNKIKYKAT